MSATPETPGALRILLVAAALVVIVAGMRAAEDILVPFLLSGFIGILCLPPLFWLQRHVPEGIAVMLLILALTAISIAFAAFMGNSINDFTRSVPGYQSQLKEQTKLLTDWLHGQGIDAPADVLQQYVDPGAIMRLVGNTLANLGGVLTNGLLILLTVVFILFEASSLPAKLRAAFGEHTRSMDRFAEISDGLQRYVAIKTTVSVATGVIITLWLLVLGVDHAVLWGIIAFLLNYIPNIGSIIAAIPAVLLASIQLSLWHAVLVTVGYVVVNTVMGNLVEPRMLGRGLGLSTLVVFLSLVFWGWVLGPVGMLLSVPLTMMAKIGLENSNETRWLAILLDKGAPPGATPEPATPAATGGAGPVDGNGRPE